MEEDLKNTDVLVVYQPLQDEVDYRTCPILQDALSKQVYILPQTPDADPFTVVNKLKKDVRAKKVALLIPGRNFDLLGTRQGRGGGWFDRFLSSAPSAWIRIGVATTHELAFEPLVRNTWDEPMDYLCIEEHKKWKVYKTGSRA